MYLLTCNPQLSTTHSAQHTFRGWTLPTYSVVWHSTVKLNSYNLDFCVLFPNSPFCGLRTVSTYTFGVWTTSDVWLPQRISYLNKRLWRDLLSRCQPNSFELFAQNVTLLHVFPANFPFLLTLWCLHLHGTAARVRVVNSYLCFAILSFD